MLELLHSQDGIIPMFPTSHACVNWRHDSSMVENLFARWHKVTEWHDMAMSILSLNTSGDKNLFRRVVLLPLVCDTDGGGAV